MDDLQLGVRLRAARIRKGLRQADLAARCGVSDGTVSRLERGQAGAMALGQIRRVAAALEVRIEMTARARGGDLERLVNARHAALTEAVLVGLAKAPGWTARPEVSFAIYGERGVVDVLAWHAASRSVLVIEVKTAIVDVGEMLGTLDRKRRLAPAIGRSLGWSPETVSTWLVVGDGMTNRRQIAAHRATLAASLPADGRQLRAWLATPRGEIRGLSLVSDRRPASTRTGYATPRRVRARRAGAVGPSARTGADARDGRPRAAADRNADDPINRPQVSI